MAHDTKPRRRRLSTDARALWEARNAFLAALARIVPESYTSLAVDDYGDDPDPRSVVRIWQDRFNLHDDWLAEIATATFLADYHHLRQGFTRRRNIGEPTEHPFRVPPAPRDTSAGGNFDLPPGAKYWDPTTESRDDVKKRIVALVDAELDRIEAKTANGRSKVTDKKAEHFDWLVRYQVLEESGQGISTHLPDRNPHRDPIKEYKARTVQKAIAESSQLIGLGLREDPYRDKNFHP